MKIHFLKVKKDHKGEMLSFFKKEKKKIKTFLKNFKFI